MIVSCYLKHIYIMYIKQFDYCVSRFQDCYIIYWNGNLEILPEHYIHYYIMDES